MKYDHFHVFYEDKCGDTQEIEGGWVGFPEQWDSYTPEEKREHIRHLAESWGMPSGSKIISFYLAG